MKLEELQTERKNPQSADIETQSIAEITAFINQEDQGVPLAVQKELTAINQLIELTLTQLEQGGRLIYIGAGTSGRLGILDASECPPTYGVSPDLVQGLIAGGETAIRSAKEGAEDDRAAAILDLKHIQLSHKDMVVGLAASGRTPYVQSALHFAREIGAKTGSIACVKNALISNESDAPVEVIVGPEVVTGSSRMKAGTAQKLILNMISTTCMIQLGKVYKGYMVDVQATNEKLKLRAQQIIQETTHLTAEEAGKLYHQSQGDVKLAIIMGLGNLKKEEAEVLLEQHHYHVVKAIQGLSQSSK